MTLSLQHTCIATYTHNAMHLAKICMHDIDIHRYTVLYVNTSVLKIKVGGVKALSSMLPFTGCFIRRELVARMTGTGKSIYSVVTNLHAVMLSSSAFILICREDMNMNGYKRTCTAWHGCKEITYSIM